MAHESGLLDLGAHHHSGCIHQSDDRQIERIAELHESSCLVGSVAVDRSGQVHRIVGHHADWSPIDSRQCGDHSDAEVTAQFENRP